MLNLPSSKTCHTSVRDNGLILYLCNIYIVLIYGNNLLATNCLEDASRHRAHNRVVVQLGRIALNFA